MNEQLDKKSILEMSMGAILERVDYEMEKVLNNILDLNTKPTGKRKHLFSGIGTRRIIFQKCCVCSSRAGKPISRISATSSWRRKKPEPIFATTARTTTAVCAVTAS